METQSRMQVLRVTLAYTLLFEMACARRTVHAWKH